MKIQMSNVAMQFLIRPPAGDQIQNRTNIVLFDFSWVSSLLELFQFYFAIARLYYNKGMFDPLSPDRRRHAMELNPVGETDLSDPGKRRNIGRSPDETEIVPPAGTLISRRRLLGQAGKALYLAPTLAVIGLAPKIARTDTISCPPPVPGDPCTNPASLTNPRTESNERQNRQQKRKQGRD